MIGNRSLLIINGNEVIDHITDNVRHGKVIDTITKYILQVDKWNSLKIYSNGNTHLAVTADELNYNDNRSLPVLEPDRPIFKDWLAPNIISSARLNVLTDVYDTKPSISNALANFFKCKGWQ